MIRGGVGGKPARASKKGFTSIERICEPFFGAIFDVPNDQENPLTFKVYVVFLLTCTFCKYHKLSCSKQIPQYLVVKALQVILRIF